MPRFGRVMTAMITPFDRDGGLDLDGAAVLANWLVGQGSDGLIVAGTTGESPTLTHNEQIDLIGEVVKAVDVPVIAGAGSNDTAAAVDLTKRSTATGAAGILTVTPYYNKPSQAGLAAHFRAVAAATDLPVLLYDIPPRSHRRIELDLMVDLASVDNIVGVKDAAGDIAGSARVVAETPDDFELYSGEDALNLALLSIGAVGMISVASHWAAPEIAEMVAAFEAGDVVRARELNQLLLDSWSYESGDMNPNPIPSKAMMKVLGQPGGDCRLPMGPEPDDLQDRARAVLAGLGRPAQ